MQDEPGNGLTPAPRGREALHAPWTSTLVEHYRLYEVILMSGFALIGTVHAVSRGAPVNVAPIAIFAIAIIALFFSIYAYNSSAGHTADAMNARLVQDGRPDARTYLRASLAALALALILFGVLDLRLTWAGLASFGLWTLYSHPSIGLKRRRGAGTAAHVLAEVLHFAMGSFALGLVDGTTLSVGFYFGILFAAGHLFHEVIDVEADRAAGIHTAAAVFGPATVLRAAHLTFLLATFALLAMLRLGHVTSGLAGPFLVAALIHAGLVARMRDRTAATLVKLRARYRACYLLAGIAFSLLTFASLRGSNL